MAYFVLKYLHVIGAAVLLGTGAGIAFFMLLAHRTGDAKVIAGVARIVVIADFLFTATAVVAQPITGVALAWVGRLFAVGRLDRALHRALPRYRRVLAAGRVDADAHARAGRRGGGRGAPLPRAYHRLFRLWFAFGFPAFAAVLAIFWLMIARPEIRLWG